ncbi:hypothetical protein CDD82_5020 [Ophiocordyceps australis]|uniref:Phospholipid/glycerol acyltransferase domain-containing protein n=1 Tax=Ophiocordyceps australis TaxID=1399860 RepID=A0A2C5XJ49_9HYPO|nr:hypothetical protein CDD82_5020 [Ophiocordyceps australis]
MTVVRGFALVLPWATGLVVADLALSLLLPFKLVAPRLVYDTSSRIAAIVWAWIQLIFVRANGAVIRHSGDALPPHESAVVISNHVAWADFYMIQALAQRSHMLGRCRYFAKRQLRAVPLLGWGLWAMGMPLISRKWLQDKAELNRVFSSITDHGCPIWLISFCEAMRFTRTRYQESQAWCKKMDKPQPNHLLYPRNKGFVATIQHLRQAPHIKAVYDLTIAYKHKTAFQAAPPFWETLSMSSLSRSEGYKFHVHVRRFPIESLPDTDEGLALWLEERWIAKGEWLEQQNQAWLLS